MGDRGAVADARTAALVAGREFHARLRAYENAVVEHRGPGAPDRQVARDLGDEVVDILERFVARQEREERRQ